MISSVKKHFERMENSISPLDASISYDHYCALDLSVSNQDLNAFEITDPSACQQYIDQILKKNSAKVAYGGYLEKRNLYRDKSSFSNKTALRDIHLGVDFWTAAGTKVVAPLDGKVHSFQNNTTVGDYGPTIILQHEIEGLVFHTLYGHLSLEAIANLHIGQDFEKGAAIATLGTSAINVNYAPHLHFQIIIELEGMKGDYPGVCSTDTVDFYSKNCPDPNLLLNL